MPTVHDVVTLYFPEQMNLKEYRSDANRIYGKINEIIEKCEETQFNLMYSPTEYNKKIDDVVEDIMLLYEKIVEIQKLKIEK